jgi:hypothetical protein
MKLNIGEAFSARPGWQPTRTVGWCLDATLHIAGIISALAARTPNARETSCRRRGSNQSECTADQAWLFDAFIRRNMVVTDKIRRSEV